MKYIFIFITSLCFLSCKQKKQTLKDKQNEIEVGSLDSAHQYQAAEIGWTVSLPVGWEVITKQAVKENVARGKKEIEKSTNVEIDASALQQLINLRKDQLNSFLSTIEPYSESANGSYQENNEKIYAIIKNAYASNGMKAKYEQDSALIDGLTFYVFKAKIYKPDSKEVLLNQAVYSRLINGYDFGMTLSYTNEEAKQEMENMIFASKFSKRD